MANRRTEAELRAKYPSVVAGSLLWDEAHQKQSAVALLPCGHEARLFSSDLWQVRVCPACRTKAKDEAKAARKAEREAKREAAKAAKAAQAPAPVVA